MKLSINPKHLNGAVDFKSYESWKRPPPRRLANKKIRCFIYQCRNIPSADADGCSDAFISVWNPVEDDKKTKVIEDNNNPIYFECLEMTYDMENLQNCPPIILNVWDTDSAGYQS